jgi:hypothetical protein
MNYPRVALAAVGAFVAYFVLGGLSFVLLPLANQFAKYPAVYRPRDQIQRVMPAGMAANNYVNLNIGLALTIQQAIAYFVEWVVAGIAIGLLYRPPAQ